MSREDSHGPRETGDSKEALNRRPQRSQRTSCSVGAASKVNLAVQILPMYVAPTELSCNFLGAVIKILLLRSMSSFVTFLLLCSMQKSGSAPDPSTGRDTHTNEQRAR